MATFYLQSRDAEGLAGPGAWSKTLSTDLSTPGSITFSIPNSSTTACLGITNRRVPSNSDWQDGTVTVKVRVTTANAAAYLATQLVRFNSSGVAQENTGNSTEQNLSATGVYTFTHSSTTWTAGACDDRFAIWYYFRSTNAHGGDISITIETGTTDEEVAFANLTRNSGTCYGVFTTNHAQFANDHKTVIAEGGIAGTSGVSGDIYLDTYVGAYEWFESGETLTGKVEVDQVGTSFSNTASHTAAKSVQTNPKTPVIRRSASACYDSIRKRYLLCGGIDDTDTQYNDLWELSLDDIGSPKPQWKKLNPTGTPMSARRTHVMEFDATNNRAIIGFGYDGADKGDIFEIDFASSADGVWGALSPSGTPPAARAQASSAFKATGDKFYLIHGWGASRYNDVWELDVTTQGSEVWTQLNSGGGTAPSTRNDPATVFDEANNRLIIFGGYDGTARLNDVWELDLGTNNYTQLSSITGTAPSIRELALACYDPVFDRMIIFGGRNGTAASDIRTDIFQLDLTDGAEAWTDLTDAAGSRNLGVWTNGIAIYDPLHSAMIYATGMDESLYETRQAFAFDLSVDNQARPYGLFLNNGLKGRDAMAYAYNPDRRETLIMGGYRDPTVGKLYDGDHTSEIWIYRHADGYWYQPIRNSIFAMPPREGASACYDTNRNRFLIFGGFTGNDTANNYHYNDTWEVKVDANGVYHLTRLTPTGTKPSARWLQATVYDSANDRMIMFGGDASGTYQNDVWELDFSGGENGAWAQLSPTGTGPSARRQPTYIYDTTNNRMIISHGATGVNTFVNDTFELDLSTNNGAWTEIATTGGPGSRRGMSGCYAADKEYMFCFGGFDGTNVLNDTYYLNLSTDTWVTLSPATQPLARRSHAAGYDQTSEVMMIFGGRDAADDGLSFQTRTNNYFFTTTDATEANWNWSFTVLQPYLQLSVPVTGLTTDLSYHWQAWTTGANQGDSQKVSAFSNAESSADFLTGTGISTESITKSLAYSVLVEFNYSKEFKATLPTDALNVSTAYSTQEYTDVETDNNVYVDLTGAGTGYFINLFKHAHANSTDPFTVNVRAKSTIPASSSTIYLQIWNNTLSQWDTFATDTTTAANTEFLLTATETVDMADYYMTGHVIAARIYQQKTA